MLIHKIFDAYIKRGWWLYSDKDDGSELTA